MTLFQRIITIAMCVLGTQITRWLPFAVFRDEKKMPKFVKYLGKALPPAVFGMLVVYCLKGTDVMSASHGIPEFVAVVVTAGVHFLKKNMFLSIIVGTAVYMLLINTPVVSFILGLF